MEKITNKTIEESTVLLPEVIAEVVAEKALDHQFEASMKSWNKLSLEQQKELDEKYRVQKSLLITYLTERAETHFQYNEQFNKSVRSKKNGGNYGRDYLYMFMYHWAGMDDKGNFIAPFQRSIEKFYLAKDFNFKLITRQSFDFFVQVLGILFKLHTS